MGVRSQFRRRRAVAITGAFVVAAGLGFGLYWFAPWDLFVDKKVHEAVPTAVPSPVATEIPTGPAVTTPPPTSSPAATAPAVLAEGSFRGLEHSTRGRAVLLRLADGSRYLRLEGLDTSNGPDLRVWITDQRVSSDWHVGDDGAYVDLGALKGNVGDQSYLLPGNVDLGTYRTAVIWCHRFKVGFGVAPLETTWSQSPV